jgi:hypothetical protein
LLADFVCRFRFGATMELGRSGRNVVLSLSDISGWRNGVLYPRR